MSMLLFVISVVAAAAIDGCPTSGAVCLGALAALCWHSKREEAAERRTEMGYRICPYCGASLDPGERCDCQDAVATSQQENGTCGSSRPDPDKHNHIDNNEKEEIYHE